jgi:hypothetical protein
MDNRLVLGVITAALTSFTACGDSSFGAGNPAGADGGDDDGSPAVTGGRADGGSDDATSMGDVTGDVMADVTGDVTGDVTCSPEQADPRIGVFVDHNSATVVSCGDVTAPCKTIQPAIDLTTTIAGKSVVYVALGTYVETIALKPGVTIKGGWKNTGATFSRACSANPASGVVIQAPSSNVTLKVASLGGSATLDTLTLSSRVAPAAPGESMYGIFATGTSTMLSLRNVAINVAAAGAGTAGTNSGSGTTDCSAASDGANGAPAGPATAPLAGLYSSTGYAPGKGNTAMAGHAGHNGQPGTAGGCVTGPQGCFGDPSTLCSYDGPSVTVCAPAAPPGCGGVPGLGGGGASGGASSVGVFAWDATVTASDSRVTAGAGGSGGRGGNGGGATPGGPATTGSASAFTSCYSDPAFPPDTGHCKSTTTSATPGNPSTPGGSGSVGSQGGGGPGGDSYAFYKGGTAAVTFTTSTLGAGAPGAVGPGNPAGPAGTSAQSN